MQIIGLVLASPDVAATRRAWQRLGVAGVEISVVEGKGVQGEAALTHVVLGVEDVAATERLLQRRGLTGDASGFELDGTTWRLAPFAPAGGDEGEGARLDHVVVVTGDADRAAANFGARLGLELRLDRAIRDAGFRGLFFRCGGAVVEVIVPPSAAGGEDSFGGIAWRVADLQAARERLTALGVELSDIRPGRKPGTHVTTVRDPDLATPILLISTS